MRLRRKIFYSIFLRTSISIGSEVYNYYSSTWQYVDIFGKVPFENSCF